MLPEEGQPVFSAGASRHNTAISHYCEGQLFPQSFPVNVTACWEACILQLHGNSLTAPRLSPKEDSPL